MYTHTTCTHTLDHTHCSCAHTHTAQDKHTNTHIHCVFTVDAVPGCSSSLEMEEVISCDMESWWPNGKELESWLDLQVGRREVCREGGIYKQCGNCYLWNGSSLFYPIKLQICVSLKGNAWTENKSVNRKPNCLPGTQTWFITWYCRTATMRACPLWHPGLMHPPKLCDLVFSTCSHAKN